MLLKDGADLNKASDEIVYVLIRHGVMYSEVEQVLSDAKEKTFNSIILKESFDAAFEEGATWSPQEIDTLREVAQMKNNQSFITLTPTINIKMGVGDESKIKKAALIALENYARNLF
ncbi:hypothetical protein MHH60_29915 [Paenibacillus sp. FSL H7-0716]|uniref:Uncharacterized protein n=1 Tax=Paenibacillus odorifer TaxID=189426 RepID=A0AB36J3I8_9BACL|nr:hypothetical protein [Paenibacillus odorifer]OME11086.1 hypothetical protein BSK47_29710 [Paenibacillus odorifer]